MNREIIPDDVRRFILACIISVPYLEAIMLLRNEPERDWDSKKVAKRLYVSEKTADELLLSLHAAGLLTVNEVATSSYRYQPDSDELRQIIDRLAETYSKNIVEVTNLIHTKKSTKVQQFADAFKWRKDS
jgi:predicted transcriptional regulator